MKTTHRRRIWAGLAGALVSALLAAGLTPVAQAAPSALTRTVSGVMHAPEVGAYHPMSDTPGAPVNPDFGEPVIDVQTLHENPITVKAVMLSIPNSRVTSRIAIALDAFTGNLVVPWESTAYGTREQAKERAKAYLERVRGIVAQMSPLELELLEDISRKNPLPVIAGKPSTTGRADVNTIIHRPVPPKRDWSIATDINYTHLADKDKYYVLEHLEKRAISVGVAGQEEGKTLAERRSGSTSTLQFAEAPFAVFTYDSHGELIVMDERTTLLHELTHSWNFLNGTNFSEYIASGPNNERILAENVLRADVDYRDPRGNIDKGPIVINVEEVVTLGGQDTLLVSENSGGGNYLVRQEVALEVVRQAITDAEARRAGPDELAELRETLEGRARSFPKGEIFFSRARNIPYRDHYNIPGGLLKAWGYKGDSECVDLPATKPRITDADLRDAVGLRDRLINVHHATFTICVPRGSNPGTSNLICSRVPEGVPLAKSTQENADAMAKYLKEHPDTVLKYPTIDFEENRRLIREARGADAIAAGKEFRQSARNRADKLCAGTGLAECLGTLD